MNNQTIPTKSTANTAKPSSRQLYLQLLSYMRPLLHIFSIAIIASIGYAGLDAYIIRLLQPFVDQGIVARDKQFISYLPILLPMLFIVRGICSFGSNYSMAWVSRKLVLNIRKDLFAHYLKLPVSFFDKNNTGDLLAKLIYNADQLYKACTDIVIDVIREGFLIIFLFMLMLYTSWKLTLVFFIFGPVMGVLFVIINKLFRKLTHKTLDAISSVMHDSKEALTGQEVIRLYGGYDFISNKINKTLHNYNKREMRQALIKSISTPTIQLIGGIALSLTLYVALSGMLDSNLTAGAFSTLFASMIAILKPIKQVTSINIHIQRALAASENIFATMALPCEPDNGTREIDKARGFIEFNHVNFCYDLRKSNDGQKTLNDISFSVKPNQTVALVGHSGAGKSTLIKLLPRFYHDYTGSIKLDSVDIKDYKLVDLRKQISIVSQDVVLFNESVIDNITYGHSSSIDMDKVITAAKSAEAYDFIRKLDNGFDTKIGENGVLLSGGQRQRLAIARAIYKDAPILILDEATSALDTESERKIQLAFQNLMSNRTTLVIAHRLSTVINADSIIVMDNGRIIEAGTHDELITNNKLYKKLYNMQFSDMKHKNDKETIEQQ